MHKSDIIVIADPHLGARPGDTERMIRFIRALDPNQFELLFLGDLFHIWAGPERFHTELVRSLMDEIRNFREKGGRSYLVAGNRDVFFDEIPEDTPNNPLPFSSIALESLEIELSQGTLLAVHGDTINRQDEKYLRWRRMVRSRWFRMVFSLMPSFLVKRIMFSLEEKLQQTNLAFKRDFPESEWMHFLQSVPSKSNQMLVVAGHFHPLNPIITETDDARLGIVVPDWGEQGRYLKISRDLRYEFCSFSSDGEADDCGA